MRLTPGAPATGFLIAAAFALLAQCGALGAEGLIWDDAALIGADLRLRDPSFVWESFGQSYFGPLRLNEMYRPLVNASFTIDWFVSGSTEGDVALGWFHLVNLLLHAANAGLAYLFLANLVVRKLGAPLIGACLFAVHPLATEPVGWLVGRCDLLAAFFGLLSGILLLRSPGRALRYVPPALLCYGLSLFAKASTVTLPVVVALAVVAYRGLPWGQLLGRRLFPRFLLFGVPAALWLWARTAVLGAPFPEKGGLQWRADVGVVDGVLGVGRAVTLMVGQLVLPARLCGDYSSDPAFHPTDGGLGPHSIVGLALLAACVALGALWLRRRPKVALPLLGFVIMLVPVLQAPRIGAIVAERFLYLPMLFPLLLMGEGLERVFFAFRNAVSLPLTFCLMLLLGVQSHLRAPVWHDDVRFNEDVLRSYEQGRNANLRLALALDRRRAPGDAARSRAILRDAIARLERPDEELSTLGAILLADGELTAAEPILRRAVTESGRKPLLGAQARYNLAVLVKANGDLEEAEALLEEALRYSPDLDQARELLEKLRSP